MNKREFIKTLMGIAFWGAKQGTWARGWDDAIGEVIGIAEELDESQKPTIPKFVADWIENEDVDDFTAYEIFDFLKHEEYQDEIHKWVYGNDDETNREREIAVLMALRYGYKVEKEKKYRVVLPFTVWDGHASEMKESTMFLALDITSGETRFPHSPASIGDYRTDLTESQIKGIDKRYWAFAEEVCHV